MNEMDFERFEANRLWFNSFFEDMKSIFDLLAETLVGKSDSLTNVGYYYPKQQFVPGLPPYYMVGVGGAEHAVQVYAIVDGSVLRNQDRFMPQPSLIVVRHSRGDRYLYIKDFGLRIIQNDRIRYSHDGKSDIIQGSIGDSVKFQAFQVPLSEFSTGTAVDQAISANIIDVLQSLSILT